MAGEACEPKDAGRSGSEGLIVKEPLYSIFNLSEERHWWFRGRRRIILDLVEKYISPNFRVLDVGCGAGETLRRLEGMGDPVGVDISEEAVRYCRRRGCGKVSRVDGIELPFQKGEFDLVLSLDVLEHIADEKRALAEYRRVIKPGGRLILTVPAYRWLWSGHDNDNQHLRRYGRRQLEERLVTAGLKVERVTFYCTRLFPLIAAVRLIGNVIDRILPSRKVGRDFKIPGVFCNRLLEKIFAGESVPLSAGRDFPFGSSLLAVCRNEMT